MHLCFFLTEMESIYLMYSYELVIPWIIIILSWSNIFGKVKKNSRLERVSIGQLYCKVTYTERILHLGNKEKYLLVVGSENSTHTIMANWNPKAFQNWAILVINAFRRRGKSLRWSLHLTLTTEVVSFREKKISRSG